jgi:hypothetical protein
MLFTSEPGPWIPREGVELARQLEKDFLREALSYPAACFAQAKGIHALVMPVVNPFEVPNVLPLDTLRPDKESAFTISAQWPSCGFPCHATRPASRYQFSVFSRSL